MSLFVFHYAGLRFAVDLLRDYEAAWLGIGTGQIFNLVVATAGLILMIWLSRHPPKASAVSGPPDRKPGWIHRILLVALNVYPLGIPTSWTKANIETKRQEIGQPAS